jgi:hypothetical protein
VGIFFFLIETRFTRQWAARPLLALRKRFLSRECEGKRAANEVLQRLPQALEAGMR